MPSLIELNNLDQKEAEHLLFQCCSSKKWTQKLVLKRPFSNIHEMLNQANQIWFSLDKEDWLEAFSHHPAIGGKPNSKWSKEEQSGVDTASNEILKEFQNENIRYQKKFGYIFLICATGKSVQEMLQALQIRINNNSDIELKNAVQEQAQITKIRLLKLLNKTRSPITTHILDLNKGQPGINISVYLEKLESENNGNKSIWKALAKSQTNLDGRIEDLLSPDFEITPGNYRLLFGLESYLGKNCFYPEITIQFRIHDINQHYHIPLLLSPFGYSTYRGT